MLKLSFPHKTELNKVYQSVIYDDRYMFYNFSSYWDMEVALDNSSWNAIEFLSMDDSGKILGMFRAKIDRAANNCSSLGVINFGEKNITFSRDFHQFLENLFEKFGLHKLEFNIAVGNPAEKMYDRFIHRYGGRIVGILKESTRLHDNKLYDVKLYELFNRDYFEAKQRRILHEKR